MGTALYEKHLSYNFKTLFVIQMIQEHIIYLSKAVNEIIFRNIEGNRYATIIWKQ